MQKQNVSLKGTCKNYKNLPFILVNNCYKLCFKAYSLLKIAESYSLGLTLNVYLNMLSFCFSCRYECC